MKIYLIVIAIFCLYTTAIMGQKIKVDQVPKNVIAEFQKKFPKAEKSEWEMENADYEVNFKINKIEWSAKFDKAGKLLEAEQEIKVSELPQIVKQSIEKEFPGGKIDEAEKATLSDNKIVYEVEVKKSKKIFEVQISVDGKILKKEEKSENKKEDKD